MSTGQHDNWGPYELCHEDDASMCSHEHMTLYDTDPVLGVIADAIERRGIKRGGVTYDVNR